MPQYTWRGIDLSGQLVYGKHFARSLEQLDAALLRRDIALLHAKPHMRWRNLAIQLEQTAHFFRYLALLLAAGIRASDALTIVATSLPDSLQELVIDIGQAVQEGSPLSAALLYYPQILAPHLIPLIIAGEESGQLHQSLNRIAGYLESRHELQTKLRRALAAPAISFCFFIFMAIMSVLAIVPRFQDLFRSMGKPLPWSTSVVFSVNDWLRSPSFVLLALGALLLFIGLFLLRNNPRYKNQYDRLALGIPLIKSIITTRDTMLFLQTLGLLIGGGVHLVRSLLPARTAIANTVLRTQYALVEKEVIAGRLLSDALANNGASPELCGLIAIGESSGTLPTMVQQAAIIYRSRLDQQLTFITTFIQPLVLIIMGLFIAVLIIVIYTPLLSLSHILF
jgi:type IV pilus assembly protein PilC